MVDELWMKIDKVNFLIYAALPLLLIIICNIGLILIVLKSARVVHKTTIIMIICLSILLIISWLPVTLYAVVAKQKHYTWYRVINYMIPIDMTLSPLEYCYFNEGFRGFVLRVVSCRCWEDDKRVVLSHQTNHNQTIHKENKSENGIDLGIASAVVGANSSCWLSEGPTRVIDPIKNN